jgi:hypothetical protein
MFVPVSRAKDPAEGSTETGLGISPDIGTMDDGVDGSPGISRIEVGLGGMFGIAVWILSEQEARRRVPISAQGTRRTTSCFRGHLPFAISALSLSRRRGRGFIYPFRPLSTTLSG